MSSFDIFIDLIDDAGMQQTIHIHTHTHNDDAVTMLGNDDTFATSSSSSSKSNDIG